MTIGSFLALLTPLILRWLIDIIIPQKRISLIILAVASLFLAYEGRTVLNSFGGYLMLIASQKMGLSLRMSLLRQLNSLSAEYYDDTPAGTAMYPLKDPVDEIAYFGSDLLPAVVKILLTTSFTLATMFALSPVLALSVVPLIPIFVLTRQYYRKRLTCDSDSVQQNRRRCTDFLQEHIAGAISIRLMAQQERQERRAFVLMGKSVQSQYRLYRTATFFAIYSSLSIAVGICAVIGYGALRVITGALSIGSLVAFYGFVAQLFEPLTGVAELYARVQKTFSSVRQVRLVLDLKPTISNAPNPIHIVNKAGLDVEFSFVTFGYARRLNFLRIPSLRIFAGEKIAIVGENGAGKSTLVKLIARIYDPTSGCIRLGQADLRNIDLKDLRDNVCYLPRDPVLFEGTVANNLRFVRPTASIGDLQGALDAVALTEFVSSLPNGLGQRIGPQGCQLSGGERQRLAVARALLLTPRILILDEATSCLDPAGELTVLKNLQKLLPDSTLIFISHRTSLSLRFERILSVSKGSILETGITLTDSKSENPSGASIPQ